MSNEFAGCDAYESGQRLLGSSDPRLKRHVASCEAAGGGITSLPAGKDGKLPRGAGQRLAESGALRPASTSLDEIQNNRDSAPAACRFEGVDTPEGRPAGWRKRCSRWTIRGKHIEEAGKVRFCRVGCKCWGCSGCGPRRASMYRIRIIKAAERLKLTKLLTLTLDPAKLGPGQDSTRYINEAFADFRVYLRRKLGRTPSYIRVLEYQQNGNAHFHILLSDWLSQTWVSESWQAVGGGRVVDIRSIDLHRVSRYLSKYLTKELILNAPPRSRRVTTSRDIHLLEKEPGKYAWDAPLHFSIFRLFPQMTASGAKVTAVQGDQDGYLIAFEVFESPASPPWRPQP